MKYFARPLAGRVRAAYSVGMKGGDDAAPRGESVMATITYFHANGAYLVEVSGRTLRALTIEQARDMARTFGAKTILRVEVR